MALAVRRLVLRSKSFHYRRHTIQRVQLPPQLTICRRSFHSSPFRAQDDKQNSQPPKPSEATQVDAVKEIKHVEDTSESSQSSAAKNSAIVARIEEIAAKMQTELGRELTEVEVEKLTEDYMQALVEAGNKEGVLEFMRAFDTPKDQVDEMMYLMYGLEDLDAKTQGYSDLARALEKAADDSGALEAIFEKSDIDMEALEKGEVRFKGTYTPKGIKKYSIAKETIDEEAINEGGIDTEAIREVFKRHGRGEDRDEEDMDDEDKLRNIIKQELRERREAREAIGGGPQNPDFAQEYAYEEDADEDDADEEDPEKLQRRIEQLLEADKYLDEDDLDVLAWAQLRRLQGLSEAQIEAERKQDNLEEMLIGLDPATRSEVQKSFEEGRESSSDQENLERLLNDRELFKTLEAEKSLHELWRRLGWTDDQGKLQKRDLRMFFSIIQKLSPTKQQCLLDAWEEDEAFDEQFFKINQLNDPDELPKKREKAGFWNEDDDEGLGEDEVFNQDDLPRSGHQELELRREIREYARWMVWELPLLSKLAKPFTPPAQDQVLRFRYTTYMGENHPSEKKIVVEFSPDRLGLTETQRNKLIKLAGVRYNPSLNTVKIACESFETPAQNKRYLGDLVEVLIKEAKDSADTFEDVPFDFRHHTPKVFHEFPEKWKLTPERKAELLAKRQQQQVLEHIRQTNNTLVDGKLFLPGGAESRAAEKTRLAQIEQEKQLEVPGLGTERERDALTLRQEKRTLTERNMVMAERKARRSTKRDANSGRMMVLLRRRNAAEEQMRTNPSAPQ